ncbi:MAG: methyltransferase family protein [Bacteroidia bacterium]
MNQDELLVVLCLWIMVFSGVFINITRRAAPNNGKENSLVWFRILLPLALILSMVFYYSEIGSYMSRLNPGRRFSALTVIGVFFFIVGMTLRWIAILSLGKSFTVQVAVKQDQSLKTNGVYRYIRHPSYTGLLLYYLGLGLLQHNWISFLILFILPLIAILNRIAYEENLLNSHFGRDYTNYSGKSKKLIPWLY